MASSSSYTLEIDPATKAQLKAQAKAKGGGGGAKPFKEEKTVKDNSSKFKQKKIESTNCCERCLFNLPPGLFIIFLPGITIFIIGVVLLSIKDYDDPWNLGFSESSIIFTVLGGVIIVAGFIVFSGHKCRKSWRERKLARARQKQEVELLNVYRIPTIEVADVYINMNGPYVNRAYEHA